MKRSARRLGILVLTLALVPGLMSTTDAGVIPWVYDAIFGPVRPYGYSNYGYGGYGYGTSYRYPYAGQQVSYMTPASPVYYRSSTCGPSGCRTAACATPSYTVGYRSILSTPGCCTTSGCSSALTAYRYSSGNCGTCSVVASASGTCDAQTSWKSKEAKTEWKAEHVRGEAAVPTPVTQDDAPMPKTFADESVAPSKGEPMSVEKVVAEESSKATAGKPVAGDPNWNSTGKPAAGATVGAEASPGNVEPAPTAVGAEPIAGDTAAGGKATAGFGPAVRGGDSNSASPKEKFEEPLKGAEVDAVPTTTPALPEGLENTPVEPLKEAAPELDINNLPLELENKSTWMLDVPVRRIAFRAGFGQVRLARTSSKVDVDYVVPTTASMSLVSR